MAVLYIKISLCFWVPLDYELLNPYRNKKYLEKS